MNWVRSITLFIIVCCLTACADQQIRDASSEDIADGHYEKAVERLQDGLKRHPDSSILRSGLIQARIEILSNLIAQSARELSEGKYDQAQSTLERGLQISPQDERLQSLVQEIQVRRRQDKAFQTASDLVKQHREKDALAIIEDALKENDQHFELQKLRRQIEATERERQWSIARKSLAEKRPISLDFRDANLRTVLDLVSRSSGINFIFDKDVRTDALTTVFLNQASVEDALDLITSTNQLSKKVIDPRTIIIYPNTPEKQREYQEQVLRVFYLANSEAKGAADFLKSMIKIKDPFVDEKSNLLAIRDSQDNVQLAERLISLYDSGEPEVLLEVEVMEVNATRLTELGIKYPDTFSLTPLAPSGSTNLTLANAKNLTSDQIGLSVAGLVFNLKREVGDVTTLANPKIRVRNKQKAKILIGDKIPVVTTTSSNLGFVSENISYLDVGLKLDVEPTVYINNDVGINIALEVSSLGAATKTASGSVAYQIGTRNASTLLRLRDGETQLLAGLISKDDRTTASRIPGLGDLPILGRLFGSQQDSSSKTELVLAITPHVLRNIHRPEASETEMWIGTESDPKLRPWGGIKGLSSPSAQPGGSTTTGSDTPAIAAPGSTSGGSVSVPAATPPAATLNWSGPTEAHVDGNIELGLIFNSKELVRGLPLTISLTPSVLELTDVIEGDYFKKDAAATSFVHSIDDKSNTLSVGVLRSTATGANGEGTVVTLRFKAIKSGTADLRLLSAQPLGLSGPAGTIPSLGHHVIQVK